MSALRSPSKPRSSTSSRVPHQNVVAQLSEEIKEAVKGTTEGVLENEIPAYRFLPKNDLERILNKQSLRQLFKKLLGEGTDVRPTTTRGDPDDGSLRGWDGHPADTDVIDNFVRVTIGDLISNIPSRRALLALFLYHERTGLLTLFKDWLLSGQADFPSDDCMPFSRESLVDGKFPSRYHACILDYQAIFKPVTIKQHQNQTFKSRERLPFIGAPLPIKDGSSGIVYERKIAPYHWEVELSDGRFTPGDTQKPTVVALKVFAMIPGARSMQEARDDFTIERKILEDLRTSNYSHKMIMLDWGSIIIEDEENCPISYALIFERATFSLQDFLTTEPCAKTCSTNSLVLAKLVDVVEALACLHDNFNTLHLDIKPDNILVFDRGDQDKPKFEWKLCDFGLSRKKNAGPRTGRRVSSYHSASRSSSLPATRHAGIYQAPEIQQRDSSKVDRGSDVWSMGCVILIVLAFVAKGPKGVEHLTSRLPVVFNNKGGTESLFYVTSEAHLWRFVTHFDYDYLNDPKPVVGKIPGTQLPAAVHPLVVNWSNELHLHYEGRPEQPIIKEALDIVFRHILLIDRQERIQATQLQKRLAHVRNRWKSEEENPERQNDHDQEANHPPTEISIPQEESSNSYKDALDPFERSQSLENQKQTEPAPRVESVPLIQIEHSNAQQQSPVGASGPEMHSKLCSAISHNEAVTVQSELERDSGQVKRPCPGSNCQRYPIHVALQNNAYEALKALLEKSDSTVTDIRCPNCSNRTPLELACSHSNSEALSCFLQHPEKFNVTTKVYDRYKNKVGFDARNLLKELYQKSNPQPRGKSTKWKIFKGN